MTADDLMIGPRGRGLLLAFAQESERVALGEGVELPFGWAVHDASFRLAKEHGHSITRFGWGDAPARREATVSDVAARLAEVELLVPTPGLLLDSLQASVDSAMYWEEPDGDDLLAATPEVRSALAPVAEHLVGFPAVQEWGAGVDRSDQWQVVWDYSTADDRPDLASWRARVLADESAAGRERPCDPRARWTGEWWSCPPQGLPSSSGSLPDGSPAGLWLVEDSLGWKQATAHSLEVASSARLYEIDGAASWSALCRDFPLDVTASGRHDWYRTTGRDGRWVIPDWSLVAEHYDGVHLGIAGYLTAATTAIEVDGSASVIAGWPPDTTWWLNDVVRPVGEPVTWHNSD